MAAWAWAVAARCGGGIGGGLGGMGVGGGRAVVPLSYRKRLRLGESAQFESWSTDRLTPRAGTAVNIVWRALKSGSAVEAFHWAVRLADAVHSIAVLELELADAVLELCPCACCCDCRGCSISICICSTGDGCTK